MSSVGFNNNSEWYTQQSIWMCPVVQTEDRALKCKKSEISEIPAEICQGDSLNILPGISASLQHQVTAKHQVFCG